MSDLKILIVEDEQIVAEDIKNILESHGYQITGIANNGKEALDLAVKTHPDLGILDIKLSDKTDGIEVAEQLNAILAIPVIFLTAYSNDSLINRAKNVEQYGYIIKPFNDTQLHSAVEMAIHNKNIASKLKGDGMLYRTIIENSLIGYVILQEGQIKSVNKVFLELLEYPSDYFSNANSSNFFTLIHPDDQKIFINQLKNIKNLNINEKNALNVRIKNFKEIYIHFSVTISQAFYNQNYVNLISIIKLPDQSDQCESVNDNHESKSEFQKDEKKIEPSKSDSNLDDIVLDLEVFTNEDRFTILNFLKDHNGDLNDILNICKISRPMVYHHLRMLEKRGFIQGRKRLKNFEYTLIKSKFDFLTQFLNHWINDITNWTK